VAMVQHPSRSLRHLFIVEDIDPAGKLDIGVDDQRIAFITLGDHSNSSWARLYPKVLTPLVANQKFRFGDLLHKTDRVPFFLASEDDLLARLFGRIWFQSLFAASTPKQ